MCKLLLRSHIERVSQDSDESGLQVSSGSSSLAVSIRTTNIRIFFLSLIFIVKHLLVFVEMIEESGSEAKICAVRAFHNPSPIKINLDKALKEL